MEAYSPSKRRALAPLDANAKSTPKHHKLDRPTHFAGTPLRLFPEGRKRGLEEENGAVMSGKKACVAREEVIPESRSQSPDESSVFDTSANDASWATAATDVEEPVRTRALTRDEAREKAEILRLRLTLANYKLRTNQIHIPLADLQRKPFPRRVVRVQSPHSSPERIRHSEQPQPQLQQRQEAQQDVLPDLSQPMPEEMVRAYKRQLAMQPAEGTRMATSSGGVVGLSHGEVSS